MPENNDTPKHDESPESNESPERKDTPEHDESPESKDRPRHDESLKRMYQNKKLAISFVKTFHAALGLTPKHMQELDPELMDLDSTEFVDEDTARVGELHETSATTDAVLHPRSSRTMSDLVWDIPSRNVPHPFILRLLVELQSTRERDMLARIVDYSLRLENREEQNRKPTDPEIRLRAGTLYTGKEEWPASKFREPPSHHQSIMPLGYQYGRVIDARRLELEGLDPTELAVLAMRMEQIESDEETVQVLRELFDHYGDDDDICPAFCGRLDEMDLLTNADGSRVSYDELREQYQGGTMAEAQQTRLEEIIEGHRIRAINEGITIGRNEGRDEGRDEGITIGRDEGITIGRNEGQIEMLCSLATMRFDAETVERFAELLRSVDDGVRLTEIGKGMFKCETPEELLALVQGG